MDGFNVDLRGRTALVTGASSGIGRAISELLLRNGAAVIGMQRRTDARLDGDYAAVSADMSDPASVRAAGERVVAERRVDVLVNNAGVNIRYPFEEFPLEDWDRVLQINLRSVVELTQIVARPMLERGEGIVINISSMLAFTGGMRASAYAASKGAIGQFTKSLANEWAHRGVRVNAIAPGFIDTDMNVALRADEVRDRQILERIPMGRWGHPADLVGPAVFLCSPAADYVSGQLLCVDGGWTAGKGY